MKITRFPLFAVVSIVFGIAGCATSTPIPVSQATPIPPDRLQAFQQANNVPRSEIQVTRDVSDRQSECYIGIRIDGTIGAGIGPGEVGRFYVPPGSHVVELVGFGVGLCSTLTYDKAIKVGTATGETRRLRVSYKLGYTIFPEDRTLSGTDRFLGLFQSGGVSN
jgi:hypothetical protein